MVAILGLVGPDMDSDCQREVCTLFARNPSMAFAISSKIWSTDLTLQYALFIQDLESEPLVLRRFGCAAIAQ